ncbi:acyl-CoA thioesterase II [Actinacidiphila glaucinigra]|uniref:acyl-CoA thioesterase n=1 Tax=Actinacidiphila glaucinigra TaxID=235986 RepID=UPI00339FC959
MQRNVPDPAEAATSFTELLTLERLEENVYRGFCHAGMPLRAFGGQVAAQSLIAAGSTLPAAEPPAPDLLVHSLHGYFIRPGRTDRPIVYEVDRTRDGRSFATRRVVAIQDGEAIFSLSASFHRPEDGDEHQADAPEAPGPEGLPELWEAGRPGRGVSVFEAVLESRCVGDPVKGLPSIGQGPRQQLWVRTRDALPGGPLLHACALTYISDIRLLATAGLPYADHPGQRQAASLDHAVWFHRPFRADEWLLFAMESPTYASSRGLARGQFFTRDGRLVASVVQEGLYRRRPAR